MLREVEDLRSTLVHYVEKPKNPGPAFVHNLDLLLRHRLCQLISKACIDSPKTPTVSTVASARLHLNTTNESRNRLAQLNN